MKAFLAGMAIGIAALVNLQLGGIAGAVFFAVGLLTICLNKWDLITGKGTPIIEGTIDAGDCIRVFFYNALGVALIWVACWASPNYPLWEERAIAIADTRIANPWYGNLGVSFICGCCIQFACDNYKKLPTALSIMVPASVFVLLGCNHCVADIMYYAIAGRINAYAFMLTIVGNLLGGCLVAFLNRYSHQQSL